MRCQAAPTVLDSSWNRYSYVWNNPLLFLDPSGEDLIISFDFRRSGLSSKEQQAVMLGVGQRFRNAGVRNVSTYVRGQEDHDQSDVVVHLRFRSKAFDRDTTHGRTDRVGVKVLNSARIRTRAEQLSGEALIRYVVNVASHEVGHASRALPEYDNDSVPSFGLIPFKTGEPGTAMGKEDDAAALGAGLREFSSRDAARLADFVNGLDNGL